MGWRAIAASPRTPLLVALAVAWPNFLFTAKWAALNGALNGPKRPWYAAALIAATAAAFFTRRLGRPVQLRPLWPAALAGWLVLGIAFFSAFPLHTWTLLPWFDDWPPRFQATVDGLRLLGRGAFVGWQWSFLGGYPTSADLSQPLTAVGALPMALFGDRIGFHLLHVFVLAAIPVIVSLDMASDRAAPREAVWLTVALSPIVAAGLLGTVTPSGDTNSIVGVCCAMLALGGSRAAALGRRWGGALLGVGLTLALYSHIGFFLYTCIYLALEAVFYRDRQMAIRAAIAAATAVLASLPLFWELMVHGEYFRTNNIVYEAGAVDWPAVARAIFYNVEILLHPHRWFNDYQSLTKVFLAVFVWVALRGKRSRAAFYAWAVLVTTVLLRFDVVEMGYLLIREMHMLAALATPPLAWFIATQAGARLLAWSLAIVVGLYVQTSFVPIPHIDDIREYRAVPIDRLASLDGPLVLVEQSPHRDLNGDPDERTERTPFGTHFEAMLPEATGRRYYSQTWDGWHWTRFRGQAVAGGSFRGRGIANTPIAEFEREMRRWGVRHLLVWSVATKSYLDAVPERFLQVWSAAPWAHYELADADIREVVTLTGRGALRDLDPLGGRVVLSEVRRGDPVVVRMNYFPAWQAHYGGTGIEVTAVDGQLGFQAPADGDLTIDLSYPRRRWLTALAFVALVLGLWMLAQVRSERG